MLAPPEWRGLGQALGSCDIGTNSMDPFIAIRVYSHTDRANNVGLGALQIRSMSRDSCDVTTQQQPSFLRLAVSVITVVLPHFGACKTPLQRERREGQYAASRLVMAEKSTLRFMTIRS